MVKKTLLVYGARPEAIKLSPLVKELEKRKDVQTKVCVTEPHRQMLDQVLKIFDVISDYDFSIMKDGQSLFDILKGVLDNMQIVLENEKPDIVWFVRIQALHLLLCWLVFYMKVPVGHVEAELRIYNLQSPYSEEFNRQAVSVIYLYTQTSHTIWCTEI